MTGCPKIATLDLIAALEPVGRGAAMGALDGRVHQWAGHGIVADSDPADEMEESLVKARPLLEAIGAPLEVPA